jgi:FG-GAP-like repeat
MLHRILTVLLLAGIAATLSAQSSVSFEEYAESNAYSFTQSGNPYSGAYEVLAVGDFNNDGKPDLIQCCASGFGLAFSAGNGDDTFQTPVPAATVPANSQGSAFMVAADFNGDGKLDLAGITYFSGNTPPELSVWYGNGDGTFQAPVTYALSQPSPDSLAIGSFFGDGHPDIAVAELNGVIDLFRNEGSAFVFDKSFNLGTGSGSQVNSLAAGDVNGTAVSQIAATAQGGSASTGEAFVLWNDGKGDFTQQDLGSYVTPDVSISRLNGDGMMDILVSYTCNPQPTGVEAGHAPPYNACAGFDVYYGQGNNTLFKQTVVTDPGVYSPGGGYGGQTLLGIDVNGDGYGDIVAATTASSNAQFGIYVWLGNADGSFQQTPEEFIYSSGGTGSIIPADFNRDGMMDFADSSEFFFNSTPRAACGTYLISPSVTACQPVDNTYSPSPVTVDAHSFDTTPVTAMQEYVDGALKYSEPVTSFDTTFPVSDGTHQFVTKGWDASGRSFVADRTVTAYTGTPGPVCPATTDSANICLPSGTSSSSPVQILANGNTGTVVPTSAQLYINGSLVENEVGYCYPDGYCEGGSSYINTIQDLSAGTYDLVFKLWDANGDVYTASKTITVN